MPDAELIESKVDPMIMYKLAIVAPLPQAHKSPMHRRNTSSQVAKLKSLGMDAWVLSFVAFCSAGFSEDLEVDDGMEVGGVDCLVEEAICSSLLRRIV